MASDRTHTCIYFDDGGPELLCVCGGRGVILVEDDASEGMLIALLDEEPTAGTRPEVLVLRRELAVSA
jgi:predicted amidohydrolase